MWYCLTFLIGFMLSGVCFGSNLLFQRLCIRKKMYWLQGIKQGQTLFLQCHMMSGATWNFVR